MILPQQFPQWDPTLHAGTVVLIPPAVAMGTKHDTTTILFKIFFLPAK